MRVPPKQAIRAQRAIDAATLAPHARAIALCKTGSEAISGTPLIIFSNGHFSRIFPGPSYPLKGYWDYFDKNIASKAAAYFGVSTGYADVYVDGSTPSLIAYGSGQDRKNWGEAYAREKMVEWKNVSRGRPVYLVGHSEGCAFAAGIAKALLENGVQVGEMAFLSCDEGDEFSVDPGVLTYQVEYMYFYWHYTRLGKYVKLGFDWVIATDQQSGGVNGATRFGIVIRNELEWNTVHGSSAQGVIFKALQDLKEVRVFNNLNGNGDSFDDHTRAANATLFYMIDTRVIDTNHPQWNPKTLMIDRSLPTKLPR